MRRIVNMALLGLMLPAAAAIVLVDLQASALAGEEKAAPDVERLVTQLGADDFHAREEASQKLAALGDAAKAALEKAARESESPEVRWRAEQLLRRLKGAGERPLGTEDGKPAPGERPEAGTTEFDSLLDRVRKEMEAFLNHEPRVGGLGALLEGGTLEAPGLVLERSLTGTFVLKVQRKQENGPEVEDVYRGQSLADILERHPELAKHPGMAELQRKDAERAWPGIEDFRQHFKEWPRLRVEGFPRGQGFSMTSMSQGVEIKQDADGVTVTIRERGDDGKEKTIELKGRSLEEIKKEHPEHADKLGNFGFSFRVTPPNFFWPGAPRPRLDPLRPRTPSRGAVEGKIVFGITLDDVSDVLASHLGLEEGRGALVHNVVPGTQAEEMGILRNDVIVKVNGQDVTKGDAAEVLSKAGAERAPLEIELIRRGQPMTLKR